MNSKIPLPLVSLIASVVIILGGINVNAQYDPFGEVCKGAGDTSAVCQEARNSANQTTASNSLYGPNGILTKVIKIISWAVGVVSVIVIIISGFRYVISQGDSNATQQARNGILYAIIGIIVVIASQSIIIFVLNKL